MKRIYIIVGIAIVIVCGIVFFLLQNTSVKTESNIDTTSPKEENRMNKIDGYEGNVLAGTTTPFLEFNQADYDKAIADGKIIFLNFYADWCPICRAEQPELFEGFNTMDLENVVGFQVNFKDANTDDTEKALAQDFQIPYQHTKVILLNGNEVFKETVQWDRENLVETLTQYANQ